MNFGFFAWSKAAPTTAKDIQGRIVKISLSPEQVLEMPDLSLKNNWGLSGSLESPSMGYNQSLHSLFKAQTQQEFPSTAIPFELAEAAARFASIARDEDRATKAAPKKGLLAMAKAGRLVVAPSLVPTVARPKRTAKPPGSS